MNETKSSPALPPSALSAALIGTLVGFGGTIALIVQAGQTIGATPLQIGSMVTALCLGIGLVGAALSWWTRIPVVLAWSTPGAALIAASTLEISYPTAIGAFLLAAALMVLLGLIPPLGRLAGRIPPAVAAAMLAGILLPFCLDLFRIFASDPWLPGALLIAFVVARKRWPTYALLVVILLAVAIVLLRGDVGGTGGGGLFGRLEPTAPIWDWKAMASLGVPLFLVTLVSQNLPGFVVLQAAGYEAPAQPILLSTGIASLLLAPFGAHGVNLAAITAAICTGEEAHPDPQRRWTVGLVYGGFYLLLALFSAPLVGLFMALPTETIAAITGIALVAPLIHALGAMLASAHDREAAVLTFAATASGMTILGIGSALWGLAMGFAALALRRLAGRRRR